MNTVSSASSAAPKAGVLYWPDYRAVWRWHFYAGLFCIPFVVWLGITGSIYLFKPQIEGYIERLYDHLRGEGPRAGAAAEVAAALAAMPGAAFRAYELPKAPDAATRVIVNRGGDDYRVYVDPFRLKVLGSVAEEDRLMRVIFKLHGELLLGDRGSMLVELAASWAVIMIVSGLYLWWPRSAEGLAGVLYPRFSRNRRVFWRDLHAVTGLWVSAFALLLLASGLPWAKFWGGNLKALRQLGSTQTIQQDWTVGSAAAAAKQAARDEAAAAPFDEHAAHHHDHPGMNRDAGDGMDYSALDRLAAAVKPLALAAPVLILPPSSRSPDWTARSDSQNRPRRATLSLDGATGAILEREDFGQRRLLDRIIGTGVAAHEGQLFGWLNQLLGLLTALALVLVSVSAGVLWWRRRPGGVLGAPIPLGAPRFSFGLVLLVVLFGVLMPLFAASLAAVLLVERVLLRRIPSTRGFLGLR